MTKTSRFIGEVVSVPHGVTGDRGESAAPDGDDGVALAGSYLIYRPRLDYFFHDVSLRPKNKSAGFHTMSNTYGLKRTYCSHRFQNHCPP